MTAPNPAIAAVFLVSVGYAVRAVYHFYTAIRHKKPDGMTNAGICAFSAAWCHAFLLTARHFERQRAERERAPPASESRGTSDHIADFSDVTVIDSRFVHHTELSLQIFWGFLLVFLLFHWGMSWQKNRKTNATDEGAWRDHVTALIMIAVFFVFIAAITLLSR